MKRWVTPRSLYNDITSGNQFTCDDDLRAPLGTLLKALGSVRIEGKTKWKMVPVLEVIEQVIEAVEKLLWDSGDLTPEEEDSRQRVYVQIVDIKSQVLESLK